MLDQVPWFVARGAGAVSLLMLTASACLGLVTITRFEAAGWPRFLNVELHRRLSLLSIAFLAAHVLAHPRDLEHRALYVVVAPIASSLLRRHLGRRTWRAIHWTSYALWPMALLHGITAGTDAFTPWMLGIDLACAAAIALSLAWRILPRGTIARTGTPTRLGSGNGG